MYTLITGASRGIGHALALEFAKNGHDLILTARDEEQLKALAHELESVYNVLTHVIPMDLSSESGAANLITAIQDRNLELDGLVNNAGLGYLGPYVDMTPHRLHSLIEVNMVALSVLTHHFGQQFIKQGKGKILQVASIAAFQPGPYMAAYYASKAYVYSLSQALAYEFKQAGISLSILCPGPTQTEFLHSAKMDDSRLAKGKFGMMSAEQVAQAGYKGWSKGKKVIIPGFMNKILAYSAMISPSAISMRLATMAHRSMK